MKIQASGSNSFSKSTMRKLKQFSFELDIYLMLSNLRIFVFTDKEKVFWDINTKIPVLIKRNSQCLFVASSEKNVFVAVGPYTFLVKKSDLDKSKKQY
jgi:hypothetical protein